MGQVRVEFDVLVGESVRLAQVADDVDSRLSLVRNRMSGFLGSGWTGGAASSFGAEFDSWDRAASDAVDVLRRLVGGLQQTAREFAQVEADNTQAVGSVAASLPGLGLADLMGGR